MRFNCRVIKNWVALSEVPPLPQETAQEVSQPPHKTTKLRFIQAKIVKSEERLKKSQKAKKDSTRQGPLA
jgi:hypothetical protein